MLRYRAREVLNEGPTNDTVIRSQNLILANQLTNRLRGEMVRPLERKLGVTLRANRKRQEARSARRERRGWRAPKGQPSRQPPRKYRAAARGARHSHMYGHLRTPCACTHTREVVHSPQGERRLAYLQRLQHGGEPRLELVRVVDYHPRWVPRQGLA